MKILVLRCDEETELHVWSRHRVSASEVEEAAYAHGLAIRGREPGIYEVYGRTEAGRYLMIAVRYLGKGVCRLITARDMDDSERRLYKRHTTN